MRRKSLWITVLLGILALPGSAETLQGAGLERYVFITAGTGNRASLSVYDAFAPKDRHASVCQVEGQWKPVGLFGGTYYYIDQTDVEYSHCLPPEMMASRGGPEKERGREWRPQTARRPVRRLCGVDLPDGARFRLPHLDCDSAAFGNGAFYELFLTEAGLSIARYDLRGHCFTRIPARRAADIRGWQESFSAPRKAARPLHIGKPWVSEEGACLFPVYVPVYREGRIRQLTVRVPRESGGAAYAPHTHHQVRQWTPPVTVPHSWEAPDTLHIHALRIDAGGASYASACPGGRCIFEVDVVSGQITVQDPVARELHAEYGERYRSGWALVGAEHRAAGPVRPRAEELVTTNGAPGSSACGPHFHIEFEEGEAQIWVGGKLIETFRLVSQHSLATKRLRVELSSDGERLLWGLVSRDKIGVFDLRAGEGAWTGSRREMHATWVSKQDLTGRFAKHGLPEVPFEVISEPLPPLRLYQSWTSREGPPMVRPEALSLAVRAGKQNDGRTLVFELRNAASRGMWVDALEAGITGTMLSDSGVYALAQVAAAPQTAEPVYLPAEGTLIYEAQLEEVASGTYTVFARYATHLPDGTFALVDAGVTEVEAGSADGDAAEAYAASLIKRLLRTDDYKEEQRLRRAIFECGPAALRPLIERWLWRYEPGVDADRAFEVEDQVRGLLKSFRIPEAIPYQRRLLESEYPVDRTVALEWAAGIALNCRDAKNDCAGELQEAALDVLEAGLRHKESQARVRALQQMCRGIFEPRFVEAAGDYAQSDETPVRCLARFYLVRNALEAGGEYGREQHSLIADCVPTLIDHSCFARFSREFYRKHPKNRFFNELMDAMLAHNPDRLRFRVSNYGAPGHQWLRRAAKRPTGPRFKHSRVLVEQVAAHAQRDFGAFPEAAWEEVRDAPSMLEAYRECVRACADYLEEHPVPFPVP